MSLTKAPITPRDPALAERKVSEGFSYCLLFSGSLPHHESPRPWLGSGTFLTGSSGPGGRACWFIPPSVPHPHVHARPRWDPRAPRDQKPVPLSTMLTSGERDWVHPGALQPSFLALLHFILESNRSLPLEGVRNLLIHYTGKT